MHLTIAIPTYDRPRELVAAVRRLQRQLRPGCRLLIRDNASSTPAAQVLQEAGLDCQGAGGFRVVQNPVNVGACANFLRILEECETRYAWVLGDDDAAAADAVTTICDRIREDPDAAFWNFSTGIYARPHATRTVGLDAFVRGIDDFGNVLFMSAGVYNVERLRPALRFAYQYAYSMCPQLVLLVTSLGQDGVCHFLPNHIVDYERAETGQQWSLVNECLGKPTLLELPMSPATRRAFARVLRVPRPEDILVQLILGKRAGTIEDPEFLYRQIVGRTFPFRRGPVFRARLAAYGFALRHDRIFYRPIDLAMRVLKGKALSPELLQSRFARM